jgi:uncharacterized delta-60 repeat protein
MKIESRRFKRKDKVVLFLALAITSVFLLNAGQAINAHGDNEQVDTTFGNGGIVLTDFTGSTDVGFAIAIQPDGKIIAGGSAANTATNGTDYGLARYHSNGSLDSSFGSNGKVLTDVGGLGDVIAALALQPDGKIVAAGFSFTDNIFDFSMVRYHANGSLDTTFGNGGKVLTDFQNNDDEAFAIVIQPDGKIVLAGYTADSNFDLDFALAKYLPDGSLDHSFGTSGKVVTDFSSSDDQGFDMVRQADGRFIVAGASINTQTFESEFALARYKEDGTLDETFGKGGKTTTQFEEASSALSLALLPDGKVVAGGFVFTPEEANRPADHGDLSADFALVKYNTDGSLDESFGEEGKVATDFFGEDDSINSLALQADGKIIAVGSAATDHTDERSEANKAPLNGIKRPSIPNAHGPDPSAFALARYHTNGSLDLSFGEEGKTTLELAHDINIAFAAAIQSDGRIVAAGRAGDADRPDFGLARFLTTDFDICLQDESNGNLLRFNSATGDYQFQNCAKGITLAGRGSVSANSCKLTLRDSGANPKRPDRNVQALVNICTKSGAATVLVISPSSRSEINDLNIADNHCACEAASVQNHSPSSPGKVSRSPRRDIEVEHDASKLSAVF